MEGARNTATRSIRIDDRLDTELRDVVVRDGITMSAFVREAVQRHVATARLEQLRCRVALFAEAHGRSTDDDCPQNRKCICISSDPAVAVNPRGRAGCRRLVHGWGMSVRFGRCRYH